MEPLSRSINRTARCANLYKDAQLSGTGLTGCQTPYLMALSRRPRMTQEQLSAELHVHKSSVTRQLASLEKLGLIAREPSPTDRRAVLCSLTEAGEALLPRVREAVCSWDTVLTQALTADEQLLVRGLMERVMHRAEEMTEEAEKPCPR